MSWEDFNEGEELARSAQSGVGNWGFAFPAKVALDQVLLSASLPPWMARTWTINLNAFNWPGDGAGAFASSAAIQEGLDQQVQDAFILDFDPVTGQTPTAGGPLRCRVEWGVAGSTEQAWVDWPSVGGSFQVAGSEVRLFIARFTNLGPGALPLLSGFMVPRAKAPTDGQFKSRPTLTLPTFQVGAGATVRFGIPPRASAYRIYEAVVQRGAQLGDYPTVAQMDGQSVPALLATDQVGTPTPQPVTAIGTERAQNVYPLDAQAQSIAVKNDGASAFSYRLQFLLDLGG